MQRLLPPARLPKPLDLSSGKTPASSGDCDETLTGIELQLGDLSIRCPKRAGACTRRNYVAILLPKINKKTLSTSSNPIAQLVQKRRHAVHAGGLVLP